MYKKKKKKKKNMHTQQSNNYYYVIVRPSVCLSVYRLSSVTLVHPTQMIEIFRNVSTP